MMKNVAVREVLTEKRCLFLVRVWDVVMLEQILGTPLVLKMLILSQLHSFKIEKGKMLPFMGHMSLFE